MWYSEERGSNQILLCKYITGRLYHCAKRIDGVDCMAGYDSHESPKKNEVVLFEPAQILPRYIITFSSVAAEDREQEG